MIIHSSELRERDVINVCTGRRLGFICDFMIDCDCGRITAVLVSDHFFSLGGGKNAVCIPWEKICCIGGDAVLVRLEDDDCVPDKRCDENDGHKEEKRRKERWFFG